MNKSHLFFNNPVEGVENFKQRVRYIDSKTEMVKEKNYSLMREEFRSSLRNYFSLKDQRDTKRNRDLRIPSTIDYIMITFQDNFDVSTFEMTYRDKFGFVPIRYMGFNRQGLFAVDNYDKFNSFLKDINKFILFDNDAEVPGNISREILFIRSFTYYSSFNIKKVTGFKNNYILEIIDSAEIYESKIEPIEESLLSYLSNKNINVSVDYNNNLIELNDASGLNIDEIIDNFDIVFSVHSPMSGVVRPSPFNLGIKEYGFEIINPSADLPIIGIIDTGVSSLTPLKPIIVNDGTEFDATNTDPRIDNFDHGTAVAAIAALGESLYTEHTGKFNTDAKILSIKVLDDSPNFVSETVIINYIKEAHRKYGVKLFVLCVGYEDPLPDGASVSRYATSLDEVANELDLLIFISAGNVKDIINHYFDPNNDLVRYPNQFNTPAYNITSPADSFNNIVCGAVSSNLENFNLNCFNSFDENYPASYSRKSNLSRKKFSPRSISKNLHKPDLCNSGGDFDANTNYDVTGIKVLSADPGLFFTRTAGTSFSVPFVANLAAKILKTYPQLYGNIQTVKALIINSTRFPNTGGLFDGLTELTNVDLLGKGIPQVEASIFSNENQITLVLQDHISPGDIKSYPIFMPDYLLGLGKERSLLEINATLCFKFKPIYYNHIAYCPLHITVGIFRNVDLHSEGFNEKGETILTGINGGLLNDYKLKESWSEDYYFKNKLLSNCHKIKMLISKQDLLREENQFKIAVNSKLHGYLNSADKMKYNIPHDFSLVISIEERPVKGELTNRLYNEMIAINELEAIAELEAEIELES